MNEEEGSLVEFSENGSFASLRIALLWDELLEKVERSPTAALGLLDIAISRPPASRGSVIALTPTLRDATAHALGELSPTDAWDFVDAIVRKMHGVYTRDEIKVVALPAARLAAQDPHGAIELLCRPDPTGAHENLFPAIAEGIAQAFNRVELALADAPPGVLARLVSNGGKLAEESAKSPPVLTALTNAILVLAQDELILVRSALMPLLLDDNQAGLAEKFFATLDATELLFEVQHIGEASAFGACQFFQSLVPGNPPNEQTVRIHSLAFRPNHLPFTRCFIKPRSSSVSKARLAVVFDKPRSREASSSDRVIFPLLPPL